ncbi:MAG: OmpA family protein [Proteobacteria bacterium]|nr:OmpA family protein [Pseudomonadota bacterium]MBU1686153.1 OmpA family protein [Pseudomonadota bacterium]
MPRISSILISVLLLMVFSGCGSKSTIVLLPDPDGKVGQVVVATEGGQQVLNQAYQAVEAKGPKAPPGEIVVLNPEEVQSIFAEVIAVDPLIPVKFILYFLLNSNELTDESQDELPQIIKTVEERNSTDIVITGHTDTVGAMEYNYKLALERAEIMKGILIANGINGDNITTTSHGEGNPLIKTQDDVEEPRNRRVEVVVR